MDSVDEPPKKANTRNFAINLLRRNGVFDADELLLFCVLDVCKDEL